METQAAIPSLRPDMLNVYKSTFPSINYLFKNGKAAIFVQGAYRTNVAWEIQELEAEVANNHPHIFVDAKEKTIEARLVDPMEALKDKIIKEHMENLARATDPDRDMGTTEHLKLNTATSRNVAEAMLGGPGTLNARLANLGHAAQTIPSTK